MPKHIVCFSGGEGSALVAIEVFRRYGNADLILLNHDIHERVEDPDIKRFKREVAAYCGVTVTYANMPDWDTKDQFDVVVEENAFKVDNGTALCTNRMKTRPFLTWLKANNVTSEDIIYYGFGKDEGRRVQRRAQIMGALGYRTDYPLFSWDRTIDSTTEIGIQPPLTYSVFKHGNCKGCLKAGMQHWYVIYCLYPEIWKRGLWAEDEIEYTIIKGTSLIELEPKFEAMKKAGVEPSEKIPFQTFWSQVRKLLKTAEPMPEVLPCECTI